MPNHPCASWRSLSEWPLMAVGTVAVALGLDNPGR